MFSLRKAATICGAAVVASFGYLLVEPALQDPDQVSNAEFSSASRDERIDLFVIGDSLSSGNSSYSTSAGTIVNTRIRNQNGWVLDRNGSNEVDSLFERLKDQIPIRITNAAWPGAYALAATDLDRSWANRIGNISNLSDQMDRALEQDPFPNLVMIWLGHNNLDWIYDVSVDPSLNEQKYYDSIPERLANNLELEIRRLVKKAKWDRTKLSVVVSGLLNVEATLEAREKARILKAQNPELFPYLETADTRFPSTRPEHREQLVKLAARVNDALEVMVERLNADIQEEKALPDQIEIRFSRRMCQMGLRDPKYLHPNDAFHLSALGQQKVAEHMEVEIRESMRFLKR